MTPVQLSWKDIDQGIYLAKQCYVDIVLPLVLVLIFICLLFLVGFNDLSVYWVVVIIWWLKPVYDRLILQVLTQHVTNTKSSLKQELKDYIKLLFSISLAKDLTLRRLSTSRSFLLPVYQLEKNEGKKATERAKVLSQGASSKASNLTFISLLTEYVIAFTVISMLIYLTPEEIRLSLLNSDAFNDQGLIKSMVVLLYVFTICITEPLYVASGFTLYMNKRKRLEAWDIELVFKTFVQRVINEKNS